MDSNKDTPELTTQTDVAALGSGVVAVAVAMFVEDGKFHPLGAIVVAALALVIVSYIGGHQRNCRQSAAFAAVMGILAIPFFGVFMEHCSALRMDKAPTFLWHEEARETWHSQVHSAWLIAVWLGVGLPTWAGDRCRQRSKDAARKAATRKAAAQMIAAERAAAEAVATSSLANSGTVRRYRNDQASGALHQSIDDRRQDGR